VTENRCLLNARLLQNTQPAVSSVPSIFGHEKPASMLNRCTRTPNLPRRYRLKDRNSSPLTV